MAVVHHHCGLTWWTLLMINNENITSIDIYILTEKTWKIPETICSVQRPVYNQTNQNLNSVNAEVDLAVSGHSTFLNP